MPIAHLLPVFALAACLGAGLGFLCDSPRTAWSVALAGLTFLLLFGRSRPAVRTPLSVIAIAGAVAASGASKRLANTTHALDDTDYGATWELVVEVTEACRPGYTPCGFSGSVLQRRANEGEAHTWEPPPHPQTLRFFLQDGAWVPLTGDRFLARGRYRPSEEAIHPYTFDSKAWNARMGITASFYLQDVPLLMDTTQSWRRSVDIRRANAELAMASMGHDESVGVLTAMLTGTKSGLTEDVRSRFAASGIAHVLAVSGMHLSLMTAALYFMIVHALSRFPWLLMRWSLHAMCAGICIPIIGLYVVFTGAPASAVRAGIMAIAVLLPRSFDMRGSGLHALSFAVLVMIVHDPLTIVDMGFQLSVVATLSLILLAREKALRARSRAETDDDSLDEEEYDPFDEGDAGMRGTTGVSGAIGHGELGETLTPTLHIAASEGARRWWRHALSWTWASVQISIVSTLGTAPFLVWGFGGIPWASPLPNLLVVPPLSVIAMPASAIGAFTMGITPWIAKPCLWIAIWTTEASLWLCRMGAVIFEQELVLGRPHLLGIVGWGLVAISGPWLNVARRWAWVALAAGVVLVAGDCWERGVRRGHLEIHAIPIGQGDCTWIRFPDGRSILVDAGGTGHGKSRTGTRYVLPYLRAHGTPRVDILVATHSDADHILGIIELVPVLRPRAIWVGALNLDRPADLELYRSAKALGVPIVSAHSAWESARIGEVDLHFLPSDRRESDNNGSLVFQLVYHNFRALFPGDIESEREAMLVESAGEHLDAHYLKIAHHGSRTSSTPEFLDAVNASIAVVHAGRGNSYNLPREDVLDRYRERGVELWRTDRGAAVVHATDGQQVWSLRRH